MTPEALSLWITYRARHHARLLRWFAIACELRGAEFDAEKRDRWWAEQTEPVRRLSLELGLVGAVT